MRIGVFGGVYNPPHLGHLILAQEAHDQLALDRVLLVPLRQPAHRQIEADPGPEIRYEMCALAAAGDDRLIPSRIELDRPGPSFTVDTLRELRGDAPNDDLVLLIGGDQAAALRSWHAVDELMTLARVAVAERDEWRREDIVERLTGLPGCDDITFFDMPRIEISSTLVRRRVQQRRSIRYLVPDAVAALIAERNLYRTPLPAPAR
jgi:nicotinate-nucleotide adenylyltransferase